MNLPYQDVCLRPDGMLAFDGIADSDGRYALALLAAKPSSGEPTSFGWLRRLAADHVRRIVAASADGTMPQGASLAACRPDALQTLAILSSVPPMNGCEYWSQESLSAFFERIENAIAGLAADHGGDLLAATATLGPGWRDVGKVSLHLAENKDDKSGTRPFAFLATFVSRSGDDGMAKHLPLSAALKVYAGKPAALSRILAPLETAAHGDKFLLSLLESRRIFQPCALSVGEAYSFLKGIGAYENAGLIVRTGRIWKSAPPKAKVSVSVGKSKTGAIGVNALCDFDVNVTLDGEPLTDEELALLATSGDGLVRIRGEWVEADHAKIDELLSRWKEAKRLMREGLTMAQALRVLAGGDTDSLSPSAGDDEMLELRATGELKDLLARLTNPANSGGEPTSLPPRLDPILRKYQKDGVEYMRRTISAGLGACLADDMGLGKTLQVLALIDIWKARGEIAPLPVLKAQDFSVVRKLTRPFILRRMKTDKSIIADLPDKTEIDVSTALTRKQALLYERTVAELREALKGIDDDGAAMKRKGLVLAFMMRFKQICDHPSLYLGTGDWNPADSGKFVVLGERAEEVAERQEKMLVFTQYREMTEPLAEFLAGVFGREGLVLHGGTPVSKRGSLVKAFQDAGGPPFFVLSVKAAGTGLNLTAANHVVHFDRWWNPAVENQASDRAFRIGQKKNVLIHKFVTPGTLEEKIDAMIKEKQALADSLFADAGEKLVTEMSDDELLELVKLDATGV